jgi:hypothetical protein
MRPLAALLILSSAGWALGPTSQDTKPLTTAEAIKRENQEVTVEMAIKASKNALQQRKEIYLDSEEDFRDPKNLAAVINEEGAAKFKEAGVEDPAEHFRGKTIRVSGTITRVDDRPRIVVSDPKQIKVVE